MYDQLMLQAYRGIKCQRECVVGIGSRLCWGESKLMLHPFTGDSHGRHLDTGQGLSTG